MKKVFAISAIHFSLVVLALAQPRPSGADAAQPSPEIAFRFIDANRDGRISREEFAAMPRFRDRRGMADALFNLLDKNRDGVLTLEEFRAITSLRPGGPQENPPPQFAAPEKTAAPKTPERAATAEQLAFFESKIRPVLVERCYECHATGEGKKLKGGLALDTREGTRKGGDTGPAVVPGDTKKSLLLEAIRYANKDIQMPPEKSGGKLPESVIRDFDRWIQTGAADPRTGGAAHDKYDTTKARDHWAYQPPKKSPAPSVKNSAWPRGDLDRFVLANLESKNLAPVADADRLTLLRRVYFDLIGLPPSLDEVRAFMADSSAGSLAAVVDRLLA
jgi:hypothetical protein